MLEGRLLLLPGRAGRTGCRWCLMQKDADVSEAEKLRQVRRKNLSFPPAPVNGRISASWTGWCSDTARKLFARDVLQRQAQRPEMTGLRATALPKGSLFGTP